MLDSDVSFERSSSQTSGGDTFGDKMGRAWQRQLHCEIVIAYQQATGAHLGAMFEPEQAAEMHSVESGDVLSSDNCIAGSSHQQTAGNSSGNNVADNNYFTR